MKKDNFFLLEYASMGSSSSTRFSSEAAALKKCKTSSIVTGNTAVAAKYASIISEGLASSSPHSKLLARISFYTLVGNKNLTFWEDRDVVSFQPADDFEEDVLSFCRTVKKTNRRLKQQLLNFICDKTLVA